MSMFSACFVKNFAARKESVIASSSVIQRLEPSTFERVRQLQVLVKSSIESYWKRKRKNCFPNPKRIRKNHKILKVNLLPHGTKAPSEKGWLFYDLGEDGGKQPFRYRIIN